MPVVVRLPSLGAENIDGDVMEGVQQLETETFPLRKHPESLPSMEYPRRKWRRSADCIEEESRWY